MNKSYCVYAIRNAVNERVYIGITKLGANARFLRHLRQARYGSEGILHRAIRKYGGENFYQEVLADGLSREDAMSMEARLIDELNAAGDGGYNIMPGGETGVSSRPAMTARRKSIAAKAAWEKSERWQTAIHNPLRLEKISRASKEAWKNPLYVEKFRQRHDEMVRLSTRPDARKRAKETFKRNGHSTPVVCSNGMRFETATDAAKWASELCGAGVSPSNILAVVRGRRRVAYGFGWAAA